MHIYKVNFFDYSDDYYFSANSIKDAKIKAEKWAKERNKEDKEEYKEIQSISFELKIET